MTAASGAAKRFDVATHTGVPLWDIVQHDRVVTDSSHKNDLERKYLVAIGSDGYGTISSLAELNPGFRGQLVLVTCERDGQLFGPDEAIVGGGVESEPR